jgi:hypothetical protein
MSAPSSGGNDVPASPGPEGSEAATGAGENPAAAAALTVSVLSLLTAPCWLAAGLYFDAGAVFVAVIPGFISIMLSVRALQFALAAGARPGNKRGGVALVLGLLSVILAGASSVFGAMLSNVKVGKMDGRALRIRGREVTAEGTHDDAWSVGDAPDVSGVDAEARTTLAAEWEADAKTEHASIAAFARLALDLIAAGAPPHLLEACLGAALEEVRHARGAWSLASAYAGLPRGPGPIPEVATAPGGLSRLVTETVIDGCLGEGLAAACAREAAAEASDPVLGEHLSTVARDEHGHAELAWDVLAFCLARGGAEARLATERALAMGARGTWPFPRGSRSLEGRLSAARIAVLGVSVQREVEERARQLLGDALTLTPPGSSAPGVAEPREGPR